MRPTAVRSPLNKPGIDEHSIMGKMQELVSAMGFGPQAMPCIQSPLSLNNFHFQQTGSMQATTAPSFPSVQDPSVGPFNLTSRDARAKRQKLLEAKSRKRKRNGSLDHVDSHHITKELLEAKLSMQNSERNACSAGDHCHSVWEHISKGDDLNSAFTSSAIAIAAAATAAKAAGLAAKLSYEIALKIAEQGQYLTNIQSDPSSSQMRKVADASCYAKNTEITEGLTKALELSAKAASLSESCIAGKPANESEFLMASFGTQQFPSADSLMTAQQILNGILEEPVNVDARLKDKSMPGQKAEKHLKKGRSRTAPISSGENINVIENEPSIENNFAVGMTVEVIGNEEGLRGAWFSAKILEMKNGEALVLYDELLDEDNVCLEEWIPIQTSGTERPKIRPSMTDHLPKAKRRITLAKHTWVVGDHVDAWIRDGWWEGVVKSTDAYDDNRVTVFFPGEGDTALVKSHNLRPSLCWRNGKWFPWSMIKYAFQQDNNTSIQAIDKTTIHLDAKSPVAFKTRQLSEVISIEDSKQPNRDGLLVREGIKFGIPKSTKRKSIVDVLEKQRSHQKFLKLRKQYKKILVSRKGHRSIIPLGSKRTSFKDAAKQKETLTKSTGKSTVDEKVAQNPEQVPTESLKVTETTTHASGIPLLFREFAKLQATNRKIGR